MEGQMLIASLSSSLWSLISMAMIIVFFGFCLGFGLHLGMAVFDKIQTKLQKKKK